MKIAVGAVALLVVSSAFGGDVLFPTPLHLVRRVDDPIARVAKALRRPKTMKTADVKSVLVASGFVYFEVLGRVGKLPWRTLL